MSKPNWPYALRVLLKAGWTEEGLALALSSPRERLADYMAGRKLPEPGVASEIRKLVAAHRRRDKMQLVGADAPADLRFPVRPSIDGPTAPREEQRGVFEAP